jgi:outer membrane biosynthesis protein TonB
MMFAVVPIHAYDVKDVTVQKVGEGVRVSVVTDAQEYKDFAIEDSLKSSERIVVDFDNSLCHLPGVIGSSHRPLIRIRASQYKVEPVPITRIVFDLQLKTVYSVSRWSKGIKIDIGKVEDAPTGAVSESGEAKSVQLPSSDLSSSEPTILARALESKASQGKSLEKKSAEVKSPEKKTPKGKSPEKKSAEVKSPEKKTPKGKSLEKKSAEVKSPEEKSPEKETNEGKTVEPGIIDVELARPDSSPSKPAKLESAEPPPSFFYNARQKRDPFRAYLGTPSKDTLLDVASTCIVGIMWSPSEKYALAEDGSGKAFILVEGDMVSSGVVSKIRKKEVVFLIRVFGGTRKVTLKIAPKKEKE